MNMTTITQKHLKPDVMGHLILIFHYNLISKVRKSLHSSLEVTGVHHKEVISRRGQERIFFNQIFWIYIPFVSLSQDDPDQVS